MRFTKLALDSLRPKGKRYDKTETGVRVEDRGLSIRVEPSGSKRFLCRYKIKGKTRRHLLGYYCNGPGLITLEEAHARLDAAHKCIQKGEHPPPFVVAPLSVQHSKRKRRSRRGEPSALFDRLPDGSIPAEPAKERSIELLAHRFYWRFCVAIKKRKRPEYVARILDKDVLPVLVGRDVRTINPGHIFELLDAIAQRAPVMANRVTAIVTQLFKYAVQTRMCDTTPVQLLMRPGGEESARRRTLTDDELHTVWGKIPTMEASAAVKHALRILALQGVRRGEVAQAQREHINLAKGEWFIPAELHKNGEDFVTFLTPAVVAEFRALFALKKSRFAMPSHEGDKPIDPKSITKAVERNQEHFGIPHWTPHDLRRTMRTGLSRLKVKRDMAERTIGHLVGSDVERTYDLHEYMAERRAALLKWAAHVKKVVAPRA